MLECTEGNDLIESGVITDLQVLLLDAWDHIHYGDQFEFSNAMLLFVSIN